MPPKSPLGSAGLGLVGTGAVVSRRITPGTSSGTLDKNSLVDSRAPHQKPSIRKTIESMCSTGSQAEYFKPEQTIIIFDWDDTLCPSSWIRANKKVLSFFKPAPNTEKYQRPLRQLQAQVESLLKMAMKLGTVIIVTNAMDPWVDTSCRNFLPQITSLVASLPCVYARSIYETQACEPSKQQQSRFGASASASKSPSTPSGKGMALPGLYSANGQNRLGSYGAQLMAQAQRFDEMAPQRWKEMAFEMEIDGFYSRYSGQSWKNIISVGDSIFERDAVRRVVGSHSQRQKKKCRTKTLKLFDEPDIDELIQQVRVVQEVLSMMVSYDGELDIEIDEEDLKNLDSQHGEASTGLAEKLKD
mmetsp:Transcript_57537/g.126328  ORF Transcript_57537/g.126328 Transcript_57537/m.126328 type:complete len:358 (+) Transcript_57537:78-1151(+)